MRKHFPFALALAGLAALAGCTHLAPGGPPAVVERLDITVRQPAFGGASFGSVGSYEFVAGVATVRVDARHPANQRIVDLAAAADAQGQVRYRTDVALLRPTAAAAASGTLVLEIANRGRKIAFTPLFDGGLQANTAQEAGNGWFMRQGHTLAWVGWQGDVPLGQQGATIGTQFPVLQAPGGQPVTGPSVEEFVFDNTAARSKAPLSYPAASLEAGAARLTVRATPDAPATVLPGSQWRYLSASEIEIDRPAGFDGGAIYTFTYTARDPKPMGLGLSALRDVGHFLLQRAPDAAGQAHPLAGLPQRTAVLMGISQSGRFLRDFLWEGFNAGPGGKPVFDAALVQIAGSRKSWVNQRFAQPGRYSRQHEDHLFPGDQFPFTYATTTDPVSGRRGGIFERCERDGTCPKLMHIDSSLEFWQARSSLISTDGTGRDVPLPDNVRAYLMGSTQHVTAATPAAGICQWPNNPAQQGPFIRAALTRLVEWAGQGKAPPDSRFPVASGLSPVDRAAVGFPDLSSLGLKYPAGLNALAVVDHARLPWAADPARRYMVQVPRTDADGHDLQAVRLPDVAVPLATHSGFNLRKPGFAEGQLCGLNGVFVPLARDAAERARTGDPRPSIAERHVSRSAYAASVRATGQLLVRMGFMLEEDVERMVQRAQADPRLGGLPP